MRDEMPKPRQKFVLCPPIVGRLACRFGFHDYRVVEVTGGFGAGGSVEKRKCRRCSSVSVRRAR